jgi:hypothetical protein
MAAVGVGMAGLAYLVALAAFVTHAFVRAGRFLDPVLKPMGFISELYFFFGRRYRGRIEGRDVVVAFLPAQGLRPAQLDLTVSAGLGLRAALAPRRPLLDCGDCPRLELEPADWDGPFIWTRDAEGVRRLLADPAARAALGDLVGGAGGPRCELYLQPERIWLRVRGRGLMEAQLRRWLDGLLALARAAELD